MEFKEYLKLEEMGAFLPSTWTGTETPDPVLPHLAGTDLSLPTVTITSKILLIDSKRNPIMVHLEDLTQLFIPHDALRRIKGDPSPGKTMTVVFQRREEDDSIYPSQIQSITCY